MFDSNIIIFSSKILITALLIVITYMLGRRIIKLPLSKMIPVASMYGIIIGVVLSILFAGIHFNQRPTESPPIYDYSDMNTKNISDIYKEDSLNKDRLYNESVGNDLRLEEEENSKLIEETLNKYQ